MWLLDVYSVKNPPWFDKLQSRCDPESETEMSLTSEMEPHLFCPLIVVDQNLISCNSILISSSYFIKTDRKAFNYMKFCITWSITIPLFVGFFLLLAVCDSLCVDVTCYTIPFWWRTFHCHSSCNIDDVAHTLDLCVALFLLVLHCKKHSIQGDISLSNVSGSE